MGFPKTVFSVCTLAVAAALVLPGGIAASVLDPDPIVSLRLDASTIKSCPASGVLEVELEITNDGGMPLELQSIRFTKIRIVEGTNPLNGEVDQNVEREPGVTSLAAKTSLESQSAESLQPGVKLLAGEMKIPEEDGLYQELAQVNWRWPGSDVVFNTQRSLYYEVDGGCVEILDREEYETQLEKLIEDAFNDTQILTAVRSPAYDELRQLFLYAFEGRRVDF